MLPVTNASEARGPTMMTYWLPATTVAGVGNVIATQSRVTDDVMVLLASAGPVGRPLVAARISTTAPFRDSLGTRLTVSSSPDRPAVND